MDFTMETCGHWRDRLFDYLYGLLDAPELRPLEAHLDQCPSCREALEMARSQQKLLAAAARVEFPHVRFLAPPPQKTRPDPKILPLQSRRLPWKAALAAAVVLVALTGVGVPGAYFYCHYAAALETAEAGQRKVALARDAAIEAEEELARSENGLRRKLAEIEQDAAARDLKLIVSGKETVQSGAPNRYSIQTKNAMDQPVPADLSMQVRDQYGKLLHEEKKSTSSGNLDLDLPANLPVKPDNQLSLNLHARRKDGLAGEAREKLSLGAPVFTTHLTTDRPLYHPGDTVRYRSLTLDRFSLKPPQEDLQLEYLLKCPGGRVVTLNRGPSLVAGEEDGQVKEGLDGKPIRGIGAGEFRLDASLGVSLPGGEYALAVREASGRFLEQERKFQVNIYETPRLRKELNWGKRSYGPGEEVVADARAFSLEGDKPLTQRPVEVGILIDGENYDLQGNRVQGDKLNRLMSDDRGAVEVRFRLPNQIARGEGTISLTYQGGGPAETLVKPIPIVVDTLLVDFYPKGRVGGRRLQQALFSGPDADRKACRPPWPNRRSNRASGRALCWYLNHPRSARCWSGNGGFRPDASDRGNISAPH